MNEFFKYKNNINPAKGCLLISEPYLPDPNFERTVILLCEHNQEGSFGFIMNKPSNLKLHEVVEEFGDFEAPLFVGGPVQQDTLHFLHRYDGSLEGSVEITRGLYWGGNFEQLMILLDTKQIKREDIRFFMGYSGWGDGQLEDEIEENSWIVSEELPEGVLLDTQPEDLWKVVLKRMGGRFEMFSKYPVDPRLN